MSHVQYLRDQSKRCVRLSSALGSGQDAIRLTDLAAEYEAEAALEEASHRACEVVPLTPPGENQE